MSYELLKRCVPDFYVNGGKHYLTGLFVKWIIVGYQCQCHLLCYYTRYKSLLVQL